MSGAKGESVISIEDFGGSSAGCRAYVERRMGRSAAMAVRRSVASPAWCPRLDVLPEDRARVAAAHDGCCVFCGREAVTETGEPAVDFLVSEARGGTIQPENLVASCVACRGARRRVHLDAFLQKRPDLDAAGVRARIARAMARLRAGANTTGWSRS